MKGDINYHVYEQERCFGDKTKRYINAQNQMFLWEGIKMTDAVEFVQTNGDTTKSYGIIKYVNGEVQWRSLSDYDLNKWCLSSVWIKLFFDDKAHSWKETMFRYDDETWVGDDSPNYIHHFVTHQKYNCNKNLQYSPATKPAKQFPKGPYKKRQQNKFLH